MSRFHLCMEALRRSNCAQAGPLTQWCETMLSKHQSYTREHFEDMPEIRDWIWTDTPTDVNKSPACRPHQPARPLCCNDRSRGAPNGVAPPSSTGAQEMVRTR